MYRIVGNLISGSVRSPRNRTISWVDSKLNTSFSVSNYSDFTFAPRLVPRGRSFDPGAFTSGKHFRLVGGSQACSPLRAFQHDVQIRIFRPNASISAEQRTIEYSTRKCLPKRNSRMEREKLQIRRQVFT